DRGEDTAGSAGKTRTAAQADIGAHVFPQTEDSEVIWALIGRRRDAGCYEATGFVDAHEVEPPIGIDIHGAITLVIQLEVERQTDRRITVVTMITRVGRA